jgi:uncharacterized protein (TIGR02145 family)
MNKSIKLILISIIWINLISILFLTSCKKDSEIDLSNYTDRVDFEENLKSNFIQNLESYSKSYATSSLIKDLQNQTSISNLSIDQDSISVFWSYEDKVRCCFYIGPKNPDKLFSFNFQKETPEKISIQSKINSKLATKGKTLDNAMLLSPINWYLNGILGSYDETEPIFNKLQSIGFFVTYKKNDSKNKEEISFEDYKGLTGYGVVYLKTHGCIDPQTSNYCIYSGVLINEERDKNNSLMLKENMLIHFIDPNGNTTYGLTSKWFDFFIDKPSTNTLFFVSACQGNFNSSLRSIIVGNGSTYFGWDKPVTLKMSYNAGITIFDQLVDNRLNCYESWLTAFKDGYCVYQDKNYTSSLYLEGARELRLIETCPTVETADGTNITSYFANVGGNVLSDGGASITERGVYYGSTPNPEKTGTRRQIGVGNGIGEFKTSIAKLLSNSTYYVKAFAANKMGTSFGNEIIFNTSQNIEEPVISDIDNNVYSTIKIGNQIWMAENLKTTRYADGTEIINMNDNTTWTTNYFHYGGYCTNPAMNTYVSIYGLLYNFYALIDTHGLCPTGWHVPTDEEWTIMTNYLGGESLAADKMKEVGNTWVLSGGELDYSNTNESGFSALPAGFRSTDGGYTPIGTVARWWASNNLDFTWDRTMQMFRSDIIRTYTSMHGYGLSVRCIKDN